MLPGHLPSQSGKLELNRARKRLERGRPGSAERAGPCLTGSAGAVLGGRVGPGGEGKLSTSFVWT